MSSWADLDALNSQRQQMWFLDKDIPEQSVQQQKQQQQQFKQEQEQQPHGMKRERPSEDMYPPLEDGAAPLAQPLLADPTAASWNFADAASSLPDTTPSLSVPIDDVDAHNGRRKRRPTVELASKLYMILHVSMVKM
jgi:hypothetical protein